MKTQELLTLQGLHQYLKSLPAIILDKLYNHPAACLATFRELSQLAKHYVMRTLFTIQAIPTSTISAWVNSQHQKEHQAALNQLTEIRIWQSHTLPGGMQGIKLNESFRANLKTALCGGGESWYGPQLSKADKYQFTSEALDLKSKERWECVLHYLVGAGEDLALSGEIQSLLNNCGLVSKNGITAAGFQFLLLDRPSQVWYILLQYLDSAESLGMDLVEILSFLFQLSYSTFGQNYSTEGLTQTQLTCLQHMREIGLVVQRKRKDMKFYPTQLAINLASGAKQEELDHSKSSGYIIVETNYRLYAYTESPLDIALVALFCEMMYRLPGLCVGLITRESVQQAFTNGITANKIINFIRTHAHPEAKKKTPIVPSTIIDQLYLWELERGRLSCSDGVLYNQILSSSDFEALRKYADDMGVLLWASPAKRLLVVNRDGHNHVKHFWKRNKQKD
ncbi:General transcription factor IIH subunit 4 [Trichoplax sp. H2]|nr:General transcription factor IIH subunit 4 [Trichoplax sp. H2]|eukprot:RDD43447.1 General transcription factor IIH subunit 4 [Trichoplax sp. H2]